MSLNLTWIDFCIKTLVSLPKINRFLWVLPSLPLFQNWLHWLSEKRKKNDLGINDNYPYPFHFCNLVNAIDTILLQVNKNIDSPNSQTKKFWYHDHGSRLQLLLVALISEFNQRTMARETAMYYLQELMFMMMFAFRPGMVYFYFYWKFDG